MLGQPVGWDDMAALEEEYLQAEEIRLLYVAATRARNLLIVSTYPEKSSLSPWAKLEPFLNGAGELEEIAVEDTPTDPAEDHWRGVQERRPVEPDTVKDACTGDTASSPFPPSVERFEPDREWLLQAGKDFFGPNSPETLATYSTRSIKSLAGAGRSRPRNQEPGRAPSGDRSFT